MKLKLPRKLWILNPLGSYESLTSTGIMIPKLPLSYEYKTSSWVRILNSLVNYELLTSKIL